jgi:hypothetical protein
MERATDWKLTARDLYRMAEAAQDAERERKLRILAREQEEAAKRSQTIIPVQPA